MSQNLSISIVPGLFMPELHYSQGDIGRTFTISLGDYTIPSGATVQVVATKPSGFGFTTNCTVSDNVITCTTTEDMTDEWGRFPAEVKITSGSTVLGTANFMMVGEKNPHPDGTTDGQQGSIVPELTLLVERVETAASNILDMTVTAETLSAGSSATYSYDEGSNTATFGIPQGEAGSGAAGVVASAYDASATYEVGDYVLHNSLLYRCTTAITTAESWTSGHWTQVVMGDEVEDVKADLYPRMKAVDGQYTINKADFDIGNISISTSGWSYNNWSSRVRTKQGHEMHLKVGDVISLSDYSTIRYYLGWKKSDNTYGKTSDWIQTDFTVAEEGDYVFLITPVPEVAQTVVEPLLSRLTITSADSLKASVMTLDASVSKNDIRTKAVREGIVYTSAGHHDLYLYTGETVDINVTSLSSKTNAYISTNSGYSIPIESVGKYSFTARNDGYFTNYDFGASGFSMNMEVCLRTRYDDEFDSIHAEINDTSYYTVDANGSGDYTSFTACIEALESDSSKKVITVLEGDYDIYTELGGSAYVDSLSGTDWRAANSIVPPNTIIKGIGEVNLLYLPSTAAEVGKTLISPLNLSGSVEVHNINIHCKNCRYAIHLEGSAIADFDNAEILLDNVNIVRDEGLYARQVLGSGLNKGVSLVVKNCTWENTNSNTFYVHTNSLVEHPRIVVENCQFITHGTSGFYLSSENKVHDGDVLVRLNNVYADNANITKADIQNGDCFHIIANGCNALTQSTFNTGYPMNDLDQYLTIS